jgi:sugar lactone lactonase YvrE
MSKVIRIGIRTAPVLFGLMFGLLIGALPAFAQSAELPETITISAPGLQPEGVEWDGTRFIISSLSEGTLHTVADDGTLAIFSDDPDLNASVGIEVDENTGRLLVTNSLPDTFTNPFARGEIALGIYDLATGERLQMVNLTGVYDGRHFANDVAVDDDGNAYVTDSFSPVVYKVTPEGEASVLVEDPRFSSFFLGLNGIVYHPDGYLLVTNAGSSELFKVTLEDDPAVTQVESETPLGFDGMILDDDGFLIGVGGGDVIVKVQSEDDWETAVQVGIVEDVPATTVALRDGEVYAIDAGFGNANAETYQIVRVVFED